MLGDLSPRLARVLAGVLVLAGLGSAVFQATLSGRLPDEGALRAAAARIRAEAAPGDEVLLVPLWAERLRLFEPGPPVRALPPDDPVLSKARRLWVVALPEAPRADYQSTLARLSERFGPPELHERTGELALLRYRVPGPHPVFRFREHLAEAAVRLGDRACRWVAQHRNGARWQCPRGGWNTVVAQTREIDYLPRECMWAHPVTDAPLVVAFDDVPLSGELVVRGGLIGEVALGGGAPVEVSVDVAGRAAGRLHVPAEPGFRELVVPLSGSPGRGPVRFTVTTPDDGRRHFCFDAYVRAEEEGEDG